MKSTQLARWALLMICVFGLKAAAQEPPSPSPEYKLRLLDRENTRLKAALIECNNQIKAGCNCAAQAPQAVAPARPAAPAAPAFNRQVVAAAHVAPQAAADASAGGNCPPQQSAKERKSSPAPSARPYSSDSGGKEDQAISPIPFPQVPSRTDWLEAHLAEQRTVLGRLYTPAALQALGQQEAGCSDPRTNLYCKMRVRMFWISNAVR